MQLPYCSFNTLLSQQVADKWANALHSTETNNLKWPCLPQRALAKSLQVQTMEFNENVVP